MKVLEYRNPNRFETFCGSAEVLSLNLLC
uniref:Uncharacterized protein n=1 Tax=Rhizophora mucronata TaxID=61149 RepID=A0A2P2QWY4_RHIMU